MSYSVWLSVALVALVIWLKKPQLRTLFFIALSAIAIGITSINIVISDYNQILIFTSLSLFFSISIRFLSLRNHSKKLIKKRDSLLAIVLTKIKREGTGEVSWLGETWGAVSMDIDRQIEPGEEVIVIGKRNKQLEILPLRASHLHEINQRKTS